jgi:hypothetical protein
MGLEVVFFFGPPYAVSTILIMTSDYKTKALCKIKIVKYLWGFSHIALHHLQLKRTIYSSKSSTRIHFEQRYGVYNYKLSFIDNNLSLNKT